MRLRRNTSAIRILIAESWKGREREGERILFGLEEEERNKLEKFVNI